MKDINSMSQFKITEDKSIMDCAAKNLEKTFDIKQKAMVNKLHNMQWLKNTSHSSNLDAVCSHLSNLQVGQDTQKLNLIKHFDGNNNHSKSTQSCMLRINKQKPTIGKVTDKNTKALMKAKDNDAQIKKTINASRKNINDGDNINNDNQKPSTPISNSKRSISNLSNTPSSVNKDIKVDRFNNKNISTRNKIEKEIKNANSSLVKTNLIKQNLIKQIKFNETVDVTCQSNNINKDGVLQKQHTVSKSISRMQESLKKNASMPNYAVYKTDTLACNNENNVNLVNAKTYLTEDKFANINIDNIEPMLGQCHEEVERIDESKANIDQQCIEINNATDNEHTKLYKHSSNLLSNKYTAETPANAIHQHSIKLDYIQHMNDVKKLRSNQTTWNTCLSNNTMQKDATIVNSQQSIQNMRFNVQQTSTQAKDETKQMPPWEPNSSKFYNQPFSVSNAMRLSQIPNTFNVASYESNIQTSNDSDVTMLEATMNRNKENSNILYKYTPNTQQKFGTFSDSTGHPTLSDQTNRRNPLIQDGFHVGPYNAMRPTIMHISNSNAFGSDDSNNTHIMNCPLHPIIYAPSPNVQTWNPQLQYPLPVFNNSPYASSTSAMSNMTNQSNNYNSIGSIHDQQLKYISCMQMDNYIRGTHSDLSNCTVQVRNIVDNVPVKSNQHYKKCQDNSRMIYNPSRYVTSLSHSESQQDMNFMPTKDINQCSNAYFCQIQKHNQNAVNYMQMSKYSKSQMIQDLACDDNESENIPPIISPKEFITANVSSNKIDQFATRVFKSE